MSEQTKFNIKFFAVVIAVILFLVGSGAIAGYSIAKHQIKPIEKEVVKYVPKEIIKYIESTEEERELQLVSLGTFETTAYCICQECCGKSPTDPNYGKTATGTRATAGRTIAVDPSIIPYGTQVVINGHTYIAEDTGEAIKGKKVDICFATHEEALQYGRRQVEVFVVR